MKKIAIITGASSGMGKDFAIQMAQDYQYLNIDEIWLIARRLDRLTETAEKIAKINGAPKANLFQLTYQEKTEH